MAEVKLYEVGGSIRDMMLGKTSPDRDFVAVVEDGNWDDLVTWATSWFDKIFQVREEFFTIRGIRGRDAIDIVMARKERGYEDGRRPSEVEPGTLEDDLNRRDFTVNAMAWEVDDELRRVGDLIDPLDGKDAIRRNVLEAIGGVHQSFGDDLLRLVRALRFSVTRDFAFNQEIREVFYNTDFGWANALRASGVSVDRRRAELEKMFKHDSVKTIKALAKIETGIREAILDGIWLLPTTRKK